MTAPLSIVFADEHLIVVNKPAGLLSVPGKGPANQDCVASRARAMFPAAIGPLIVHRLDMDTSGLLVLGLTPQAQRDLSKQFEQRTTSKAYIAVVAGIIEADAGEVSLPIRTDIDDRPRQIVDFTHGKPSITRFAVLARDASPRTRLRLVPITGRTHQLRVHCAAGLHTPIVGDPLYGDRALAPRMLLHAAELAFNHPATGERIELQVAPDF
jgi:tRNA pseudouridine32 synthase / 23S rRNA pseudouridine746 synthase